MKTEKDLKILLLQIRDDKETMEEEFYDFVQFSGLHESQFTVLNTFITQDFDTSVMKDQDALFIGGSSDASVLKPEEFVFLTDCRQLIRHCYDHNIPVFASCFGFQLAVQELGGEVILDEDQMEMGSYEILITNEAKEDPLFYDMPESFWGIAGHQERALSLPENTIPLAYTIACPYQAFKIKDKPFYGFQFHPEMATKDLVARLYRYQERYLSDAEEYEKIIENANLDTTAANSLVRKFIERVLLA